MTRERSQTAGCFTIFLILQFPDKFSEIKDFIPQEQIYHGGCIQIIPNRDFFEGLCAVLLQSSLFMHPTAISRHSSYSLDYPAEDLITSSIQW